MDKSINISFQLLLLNDLLSTKVIDKNIYDKALEKIKAIKEEIPAA